MDDTYFTPADTQLVISAGNGLLVNDSDPDGDSLVTLGGTTSELGATLLIGADGGFTYTPTAEIYGKDSFTYTIDDGNGGSDQATVTVTVSPSIVPLADPGAGIGGFPVNGLDYFRIGWSVAEGGDVNGDGYEDVLVGSRHSGRAYIVFGKDDTLAVPAYDLANGDGGFTLLGEGYATQAGYSVDGLGDIDGDGLSDMLMGAWYSDSNSYTMAGRAFMVLGRTTTENADGSMLGTGGRAINGTEEFEQLSFSVSGGGDVNGDGLHDYIVSAPGIDPSGDDNVDGGAYVVFGGSSTTDVDSSDIAAGTGGFAIHGEAAGWTASIAAIVGDVNGDGLADLALSDARSSLGGQSTAGRIYVVHGKTDTTAIELSDVAAGTGGFIMDGEANGDYAGQSLSRAGDVNGDGLADFVVGAPRSSPPTHPQRAGKVYIVFGKTNTSEHDLSLISSGSGGFVLWGEFNDGSAGAGRSVGDAGDVNGDGLDDVVVGHPTTSFDVDGEFAANIGRSYVVYGKSDNTNPIDLANVSSGLGGFAFAGETSGDRAGRAISGAGDVNGDGFDDVVIATPYANGGGTLRGIVYIFAGGNFSGLATHEGTEDDNMFVGASGVDYMIGGDGDDVLDGQGGADVFRGGRGDDVIHVADVNFFRIDGGTGDDTVALAGPGLALDLTTMSDMALRGIERFDLTGSGNDTLTLNLRDLRTLSETSNTVTVVGDGGDVVNATLTGVGMTNNGSSNGFTEYSNGVLTLLVDDDITANVSL